LQDSARGRAGGRETHRLRAALVVAQIALALILLLGAGAMVKGFVHMASPNRGVDARNVLTMLVRLPQARDPKPAPEIIDFEERVRARLQALPGVEAAATVNNIPWGQNGGGRIPYPEGRMVRPEEELGVDYRPATPGYLELLRVPRLEGRGIEERDGVAAPLVALVSTSAAQRLWPGESAVGKRFRWQQKDDSRWLSVVGVVGDVRDRPDERGPRPAIWVPFVQKPTAGMYFVLRTAGEPFALSRAAARAVYAVDPSQPVIQVRTLDMVLDER